MNDKLQILITAGLNEGLSIGEINKGLKKLAKHPSLQKLRVSVEIDKRVLDQLSKLSSELRKTTNVINQQRSVSEQTKKTVNDMTVALDKETASINQNTEAMRKNAEMQRKITEGADFIRTDTTTGSRFNRVTTSVTDFLDEEGNVTGRVTHPKVTVTNYESYREAQKQLQVFTDDANKRIQMLSRTFGEGSEEIIRLKNSIAQLTPEASRADYSKITNQIKELERSERLLNQAYKENELFNVRRQKDIDAVTNRINNLRTEIQRFNRAGKELPYGKGQALDNMLTDLKNIDVTNLDQANKKLNELEGSFKRLNQTALAREGLLKQLNNMKLDGVIDEKEITKLETAIRKAETPEQIRKLGQEYGKLRREQQLITQVLDKKPSILKQINNLREQGLITEKQALTLEKELANAQTKRAVSSVKKQVDNIQAEVGLRQKNLNLLRQTEITINRLTNNPLARRYRGELASLNTELQRINLSGQATANRLKEIQHRLREIGVEATGTTYKTSTFLGAFQNAMVNILPPNTATY